MKSVHPLFWAALMFWAAAFALTLSGCATNAPRTETCETSNQRDGSILVKPCPSLGLRRTLELRTDVQPGTRFRCDPEPRGGWWRCKAVASDRVKAPSPSEQARIREARTVERIDPDFQSASEEAVRQTDAKFCAKATEEWQRKVFCHTEDR